MPIPASPGRDLRHLRGSFPRGREPLARACIEEARDEFQLTAVSLVVAGGTGSPVNPIAVF